MADVFEINVKINGRLYPLDVERVQEVKYRDAASMVNSAVSDYEKEFPDKDAQDFLSMAAFQLAMKIIELEEDANESSIVQELRQMNEKVNRFLSTDE